MDGSWELYARIGIAVVAGITVGLERELRGHPAGMRTHTLVAVGAALFTLAGAYGFSEIARGPNIDPARVAAQVASGIGFIGAGAIIRDGARVRGITTAATLWLSGALGMASGAGMYVEVLVGTGAVLLVLTGLRLLKPWLQRVSLAEVVIRVEYERGHGTLGPLTRGLDAIGGQIRELRIDDPDDRAEPADRTALFRPDTVGVPGPVGSPGLRRVTIRVASRGDRALRELGDDILGRPEVRSFQLDAETD